MIANQTEKMLAVKYRKTCHILLKTKRLLVDYDVLWEEVFKCFSR